MPSQTLWTPKINITEKNLEFFRKIPDNRKDYEPDISRQAKYMFVGEANIENDLAQYNENNNKFLLTCNAIASKAAELNIVKKDAEYFSYLMTHLCYQVFAALPVLALNNLGVGDEMKQIVADNDQTLPSNSYKTVLQKDKLIWSCTNILLYQDKVLNTLTHTTRTINYNFYPDKTMQMSMENPKDAMEQKGQEYFEMLSTASEAKLQRLLQRDYKENDPYTFLAINCDPEQCKMLTYLVNNRGYKKSIDRDKIKKCFAIEKLRHANPYTIARLIDKYIQKNPVNKLKHIQDVSNELSTDSKKNIEKITIELDKRNEANTLLLTISDCINIVVNFFLKIAQYFGLHTSAVTSKDFEDFCKVVNVVPEDDIPQHMDCSFRLS